MPVGEEWPRIQGAIPQIFEQVSVQSIRSGLGDDVDRRAGVRAEARRQSAGLDIELLQRVRERERQIHVGHRVCIIAAVEKVSRAISLAACDGDRGGTEIILAADHAAAGSGHGSAGKQDQLSGLAAIQRQVIDAPLVDHLPDAVLGCLHHAGGCNHLDGFRRRPNLERNVLLDVAPYLQHDARLGVILETRSSHFESVGSHGKVGNHVTPFGVGHGSTDKLLVRLHHANCRSRNGASTLIGDYAADVSHRHSLSMAAVRHARCQQHCNHTRKQGLAHTLADFW